MAPILAPMLKKARVPGCRCASIRPLTIVLYTHDEANVHTTVWKGYDVALHSSRGALAVVVEWLLGDDKTQSGV